MINNGSKYLCVIGRFIWLILAILELVEFRMEKEIRQEEKMVVEMGC